MGVPAPALADLRDRLAGSGALAEAGAPEHLREVLIDAMQGTWFRLDFGSVLSAEAALEAVSLSEPMPFSASPPLWPDAPAPTSLACGSWSDDFVRMTSQPCHRTLTERVVRVVTIFTGQADALALS